MINNWEIIGNFMYEPSAFLTAISLIRSGLLNLDAVRVKSFALNELPAAMDAAAAMRGLDCTILPTLSLDNPMLFGDLIHHVEHELGQTAKRRWFSVSRQNTRFCPVFFLERITPLRDKMFPWRHKIKKESFPACKRTQKAERGTSFPGLLFERSSFRHGFRPVLGSFKVGGFPLLFTASWCWR